LIEEYIGKVATGSRTVSIARMVSPKGWVEPAQTPEFDEYTIVLRGELHARINDKKTVVVKAGSALTIPKGTKVQYHTPVKGAEYIAVCIPAFSPKTVHREE
jgi:ethanolamine utilization protein EutQ (cupin superfamily)